MSGYGKLVLEIGDGTWPEYRIETMQTGVYVGSLKNAPDSIECESQLDRTSLDVQATETYRTKCISQ